MQYFQKPDGSVWAFEDNVPKDSPYITADMTPMTAAEIEAHINPVPTQAQLQATNEAEIQAALDAMARTRGYDSIASACTYASSTPAVPSTDPHFATCEKFRLEGNALQAWKSITWATAYAYLATVTAGTNPMPTPAQAVAMIPAFTWPD